MRSVQQSTDLIQIKGGTRVAYIHQLQDRRAVYIHSCGILNFIWQSWNHFWRIYWLAHVFGGRGYQKLIIRNTLGFPIMPKDEGAAIFQIFTQSGFNTKRFKGTIPFHNEPTWGSINTIEKIAMRFSTPGTQVLSALSVFGQSAEHLQAVRNCSIHIGKSGIVNLKSHVLPYYSLSNFKYPTEIMYADELGSSKMAIVSWTDEILALLELI